MRTMTTIAKRALPALLLAATTALTATAGAREAVPQSVLFATYDTETKAADVFKALKESQHEGVIHIDSYAVISKDIKGKVHVHSQQKRGAIAGAVVGALIGVVGGPVGMAVGAGAGGGIGYLTGDAVGIPQKDIDRVKAELLPGTSAIIVVIDERWVSDMEKSLREMQAKDVLNHRIAGTPE